MHVEKENDYVVNESVCYECIGMRVISMLIREVSD